MKREKIVASAVSAAMFMSLLPNLSYASEVKGQADRYYGTNRYLTSVEISKKGFEGADAVVIANGDDYADALCAAPLAKKFNAPILLVSKNEIKNEILDEIKRLGAKEVYIVGGSGAVSDYVKVKIESLGVNVKRVAGLNRYETSYEVAKLLDFENVAVASGENFPDALSIAPVAANLNMPILLTKKNELPKNIKKIIDEKNPSKVYFIGGSGVISNSVLDKVKNAERIAGKDRFETNVEVAKYFDKYIDYGKVYIAVGQGKRGNEFADALSASPLAAKTNSFVFLTGDKINDVTIKHLDEKVYGSTITVALGGDRVVPNDLLDKATVKFTDVKKTQKLSTSNVNVRVSGEDVLLSDATCNKNLFVDANNVVVKNVNVKGTLFVNPGKDGVCTLENVNAGKIVVLSGGENSIHINNVKAEKLEVKSSEKVRVVSNGQTAITETVVISNAKVEVNGGSVGVVKIDTRKEDTVELKGTFDKPVEILTSSKVEANETFNLNIKVKTDKNTEIKGNIDKVEVEGKAEVKLSGNIKEVAVKQVAKIELREAKVEVIKADVKVEVNVDKQSKVEKTEGKGNVEAKGEGANNIGKGTAENNTQTENTGGSTGSTGGTTSGTTGGNTGSTGGTTGGTTGGNTTGTTYTFIAQKQTSDGSISVKIYKNSSEYKLEITSSKKQTITMRIEDKDGNIQYIDQIDDLQGSKEIKTTIITTGNKLFVKGSLTEMIQIDF